MDDDGKPANEDAERVMRSLRTALAMGKGSMMVLPVDDAVPRHFSRALMCPTTGISYPEPEPNLFSFNSPTAPARPATAWGRSRKPPGS